MADQKDYDTIDRIVRKHQDLNDRSKKVGADTDPRSFDQDYLNAGREVIDGLFRKNVRAADQAAGPVPDPDWVDAQGVRRRLIGDAFEVTVPGRTPVMVTKDDPDPTMYNDAMRALVASARADSIGSLDAMLAVQMDRSDGDTRGPGQRTFSDKDATLGTYAIRDADLDRDPQWTRKDGTQSRVARPWFDGGKPVILDTTVLERFGPTAHTVEPERQRNHLGEPLVEPFEPVQVGDALGRKVEALFYNGPGAPRVQWNSWQERMAERDEVLGEPTLRRGQAGMVDDTDIERVIEQNIGKAAEARRKEQEERQREDEKWRKWYREYLRNQRPPR